ncbi:MAG: hypothetical protein L0Y42_12760 [Phycisphaerales bacterium]|nr:hypothetical protein [Phycisphaerales bacterium]
MLSVRAQVRAWPSRRSTLGFTLLESLMATGILLTIVVSVTSAITAGQQQSHEAHQKIAATLAGEELMGRLLIQPYDQLPSWNGYSEPAGAMTDASGKSLPSSFDLIGRDVSVATTLSTITLAGSNNATVRVRGRQVQVRSFNAQGRVLAEISRFIVEPQP